MEKSRLEKAVKNSTSFSEVSRLLYGNNFYGNRVTIKKYIKEFGIDYSHFTFLPIPNKLTQTRKNNFIKRPLSEIMVENSSFDTTHLKERLYEEGLKKRICEMCEQNENWHGNHMSLILDHINGINNDHRLENLRILCPNCSSTLPTHGGKNIHRSKCKKEIKEKKIRDNINVLEKQRKVKRPEFEQLQKEIEEFGYSGTGRKYGVSDNAIRKWIKYYQKYTLVGFVEKNLAVT